MKLTIIIPAYNEEEAIKDVLDHSLQAKTKLIGMEFISDVDIVVISDGSSDDTVCIAREYENEVRLIEFNRNRGYGAALKYGIENSDAEYVAFYDADGTCDPNYLIKMVEVLRDNNVKMIVGNRLHKDSSIPIIRRVGNWLYAKIVTILSGTKVTDVASGMRILKKDFALGLYPLPDQLNFTTALTCKAIFNRSLLIKEIDIPYQERSGNSKLLIFNDGITFLITILQTIFIYCPLKVFGTLAAILFSFALVFSIKPILGIFIKELSLSTNVYRLIVINSLVLCSLIFLAIGILSERVAIQLNESQKESNKIESAMLRIFTKRSVLSLGPILTILGSFFIVGSFYEYVQFFKITTHWAYVAIGSLFILAGMQISALWVFNWLVTIIVDNNKKRYK